MYQAIMQYFIFRQVIGLVDYLQWYLVDICSLFNMVSRLFSSETKNMLEATGQQSDECNSLCKLATECPDTPWVSRVEVIAYMHVCNNCIHTKLNCKCP